MKKLAGKTIVPLIALTLFWGALQTYAYFSLGAPKGYVSDYTGTLSGEVVVNLESILSDYEKESSSEISVVMIESLKGDYIENFAVKLFLEWGIGKKDKDNGVLFLIAKSDRQMRIEVGYGLEGALTDAISSQIIAGVGQYFKSGDYDGGVVYAVESIISATKGEYKGGDPVDLFQGIGVGIFIFLYFFFVAIVRWLGKSKSWWIGGVIGAITGYLILNFWGLVSLGLLGLLIDYIASKSYARYKRYKAKGGKGTWLGGGGIGLAGDFGGQSKP